MRDENSTKSKLSRSKTLVRKWFNIKSKAQDFHILKNYKDPSDLYIKHINKETLKRIHLLIIPIIHNNHWTLLVGRLKERVWKLYDSLPNPQHKDICVSVNLSTKKPANNRLHEGALMFVATWNVGGKSPPSCLNLDWLHSSPPADIYVLGFQEIVPLNAGNVLGTEDNGPASKWISIIRKTLNNLTELDIDSESLGSSIGKKNLSFFHRRSLQSLNHGSRIDGDLIDHQAAINRRFSVCDEVIFGGRPSDFDPSFTWGVSSDDENVEVDSLDNLFFSPISYGYGVSTNMEDRERCAGLSRYCLVVNKQMVGIFLTLWVRCEIRDDVKNLKVSHVGRGLMGYLGNKTVLKLVVLGKKEEMNSEGIMIRVIWLGDLNYRIALSYQSTKALIEMQNWKVLLEKDQLRIEQRSGRVFVGWNEGRIYFPPTYKFSTNSDRYSSYGIHPKEKRRAPAWCDRIDRSTAFSMPRLN
ncbi:hypothetical protein M5K25_017808 [Dendrobium thyrsiflorum]|uniref:Inositol polyphosphate-related phosphatase domain-containing protein n=1 Tax=Dendrobium thyrsiflorum TaxID=117978 RepID=A0ABD0UNK7_DENTH